MNRIKNTFPNIHDGYRPRPVSAPGEGLTVLPPKRVSIGARLARLALGNLERLGLHKPAPMPQGAPDFEQHQPNMPIQDREHLGATSGERVQAPIQAALPTANVQDIVPAPPEINNQADSQPPHSAA